MGSAAGCAIGYLVRQGAVKLAVRVPLRQSAEVQRPSELHPTASLKNKDGASDAPRVANVRVAGSTVPVATGRLFLPRCTLFQQKFIKPSDGACTT